MSETNLRVLDWHAILAGLAQLHNDNPCILERNVLVGGAACMFYRDQLEGIGDHDFQVRAFNEEEERRWLSRDADFATTEPDQIPDHAGVVPLGRLQMGFSLGADEFKENARNVSLLWNDIEFSMLIADPLDLWREKEAAIYRLRRPQDALHLEILGLMLQWEMAYYAECVAEGSILLDQWLLRSKEVQERYRSIFNNQNLIDRLTAVGIPEIINFVFEHKR